MLILCYCCFVHLSFFRFSTICYSLSLFLSLHAIFFRHEINPNNLVNASKHQTMQIFNSFLSKLPLSSSSHSWNVITNHFNNQATTHATHSINYELFSNANANVNISPIQNQHDEQFAINFDNELRHRHFNQTAICNPNYYHAVPYYNLTDSCARATCKHRRTALIIDHVSRLIAHFSGNYHVISYVIIGIAFYGILFYFIYCIN